MLLYDATDLLRIENIIQMQATYMVPDAMNEARTRADAYAIAGGRKRDPSTRRYRAAQGQVRVRSRASGNLIAWMAEKMLYKRFVNFWTYTG